MYCGRCCRILFEEKVDDIRDQLKVNQELINEIKPHQDDEGYKKMFLGGIRKVLWDLMENPYSSLAAKAFAVFSSLLVLISIVAMTLNTVKELRVYKVYGKTYMELVEIFSILFFTLEYFLRLFTTADIKHFVKSTLNFVDLAAVLPYFLQIVFELFFIDTERVGAQEDLKTMARVSKVSKVLKVVKLMRIFRILKLARHSTGMRAFGFTIRQCSEQVGVTPGRGDCFTSGLMSFCYDGAFWLQLSISEILLDRLIFINVSNIITQTTI